ncbi:thiamine ABC transporter substrate binding subunit [Candidatus Spongiihabitans sp.]|uniref:thiamine ABC transporter substrate binding subunit n=1 Tax=Candidatus Spongiihabitans sp. TaxID=3101308 RepID=UPI003C7D15B2
MRKFILVLLPLFSATVFLAAAANVCLAGERPVLNVYTYDSFAAKWGAGPKIKQAFEAQCHCELNYVAVDSSTGILSRVQLEGAESRADVVLGLDNGLMVDAQKTGLLSPHNVFLTNLDLPFAWDDPTFLPFDYGYFAFIYNSDKLSQPPTSFQQLVDARDSLKILIQDPRSSTPGLGLVLWVKALYGDGAAAVWRQLSGKILTVTKGWSEAYGLFLDGEADLVLSYTTSPAYHLIAQGQQQYRAAAFSEGHGVQIEVAAQLKNAPNPALAQQFMDFILSDGFQSVIPTGQWMYPVKNIAGGLPPAFDQLVKPAASLMIDPRRIAENKAAWVDEFSQALSQ